MQLGGGGKDKQETSTDRIGGFQRKKFVPISLSISSCLLMQEPAGLCPLHEQKLNTAPCPQDAVLATMSRVEAGFKSSTGSSRRSQTEHQRCLSLPTSFLQIGKLSSQGDRIRKRLLISGLSEKQPSVGLRREMALSTLSLTLTVLPSSSQLALVVMGDYLDATAVPKWAP